MFFRWQVKVKCLCFALRPYTTESCLRFLDVFFFFIAGCQKVGGAMDVCKMRQSEEVFRPGVERIGHRRGQDAL